MYNLENKIEDKLSLHSLFVLVIVGLELRNVGCIENTLITAFGRRLSDLEMFSSPFSQFFDALLGRSPFQDQSSTVQMRAVAHRLKCFLK